MWAFKKYIILLSLHLYYAMQKEVQSLVLSVPSDITFLIITIGQLVKKENFIYNLNKQWQLSEANN